MACRVDMAVHIMLTALFVALLCGPAAVYHYLSQNKISETTDSTTPPTTTQQGCIPKPYSGTCLRPLQSCVGGEPSSSVWIDSSVNVAERETLATKITSLLQTSSTNCLNSSQRFLCQYLFPPCDDNGTLYLPTQDECVSLRAGVCSLEWQLAPSVGIQLPVCADLPNTTSICNGNVSALSGPQTAVVCSSHYYHNGTACLAECGVWEQYPPSVAKGVIITELLAASFGCATQILLMAMFLHQWRRVSRFPTVFITYHTICYFMIATFAIINHSVPYAKLFCSKKSVIESYTAKPTVFCTMSGIVLQYFFVSMCWWWLFHIASVFWMFVFPYHAKTNAKKIRCVHAILAMGGVLLPLPGVIAALATGGYTVGRHPPLMCITKEPSVFYYSVVLLTSGILAAGLSMLVILYWTVYKHTRSLQRQSSASESAKKENKRHMRLLAVLTYYVLFGILAITQQSLELGQYSHIKAAVEETFRCEATGQQNATNVTCPARYQNYSYPAFGGVVYLLMGLIPLANMVFVFPAWDLWTYCIRRGDRQHREMRAVNTKTSTSSTDV